MTGNQNIQLGQKHGISVDLKKLKSGVSAEAFKDNAALKSIFDSCDKNKNTFLEDEELDNFKSKLTQAAGEDAVLSDSEAKDLLKAEKAQQEEQAQQAGQTPAKMTTKAKDLYAFTDKLNTLSEQSDVKSSRVEGDKRVVEHQDGAQEIINQDGSKIITTISGGIKTVQTKNADGKLEKEEITNEEDGTLKTVLYDNGIISKEEIKNKENETLKTVLYDNGVIAKEEISNKENGTFKTVLYADGKLAKEEITNEEKGSLETVLYGDDGETIKEHTLSTKNATYTIGTEGFGTDKVTKEVRTDENGNQIVSTYNYTNENEYTKTTVDGGTTAIQQVVNGEVKSTDIIQVNADNQKVQDVHVDANGTSTTNRYNENGNVVYNSVMDQEGKTIETAYDDNGQKTLVQITDPKGKISAVKYDENGKKDIETVKTFNPKTGKVTTASVTKYKNGQKLQTTSVDKDGTETIAQFKDGYLSYDRVTTKNGRVTETEYNKAGFKTAAQITNPNGTIQLAEYDGKGHTKVIVQNGETIDRLASRFRQSASKIISLNHKQAYSTENGDKYFLVGAEVLVAGEFAPNAKGLQHRNGAAAEIAEYTAQEQERVVARLQGKQQKAVTVQKDYSNWYKFAEEQLKSEGVANPTKAQVNDRTNELLVLNPNVEIPKKGVKIVAIKTAADIQAEKVAAEQKHSKEVRRGVVNEMVTEYNAASRSFNNQMKKDGWAADVADAVSYIWNNDWWSATGNTARQVRQDLATYKKQVTDLKTAYAQGEDKFKAKFKETFGVEYSQQKVEAYNAKRKKLEQVSTAVATEKAVKARMDDLFAKHDKEKRIADEQGKRTGLSDMRNVYSTEYAIRSELQKMMGLSNADMAALDQKLAKQGKSMDINYMRSLYSDIKKGLALNTKKALAGKTVEQYQKEVDSSYKQAFGTRSDIGKRVADYNSSQDTGAAVVKTTTKLVGSALIAVASGGSASGLLVAALGSSALSFTVDATDMMSDGRKHTASEYGTAAKNAAIDGTAQVISGGMSKYLKAAEVSRVVRYSAQAATDLTVDLGAEYLETGEVNLSTAITSVLSSVGGEALGDLIEARQIKKAKAAAAAADIDPLYKPTPDNWASMSSEERAAFNQKRVADSEAWRKTHPNGNTNLGQDAGWLGQPSDSHHRYQSELSAEQLGNVPTHKAVINGVEVTSGDARGVRFDVSMSEHNEAVADITNLLGEKGAKSEFGQGLVTLEDRFRFEGAAAGAGATADNARPYGTFASNEKVKAMGLEGRLDIVKDAAQVSGMAYSDKDLAANGWSVVTSTSADNGFHAKAYEKEGVVMVAFRGSDDVADLRVDHQMISGKLPDQFDDACAFLEQIKKQYPDAKIVVTGHSLGGALTELVSSKYDDVLGLSFDAVGTKSLVQAHGLKDNHNTINYIVNGDIISNASEHVGTVTLVNEVVDVTKGGKVNSPHAIGNFMGNGNNSLSGVEAGFVQRTVDGAAASRSSAAAKGLTLETALSASTDGVIDDKVFNKVKKQFASDVQGMNVDLDALQAQVNGLTNPAQKAQLQGIIDARRNAITVGADIKARSTVLQAMTGDEINDVLARDFGFTEPGFLGGDTPSSLIQLDKDTKFVRVFNDESSFAKGSWLMPYDEVQGLTAAEIKDKFALPAMPKFVEEIEVPAGAQMYTGKCNPLEGWGNGGGTQFFLIGQKRPKIYGNMVALPQ